MSLMFDALLILALVWSAWRSLAVADPARAVIMFIVFGLLMTIAWARLSAPDIALAEAAIGAGLTGALLLDAVGFLKTLGIGSASSHKKHPGQMRVGSQFLKFIKRLLGGLLLGGLAVMLIVTMLGLPAANVNLPATVMANMAQSGVEHPVTAVLLNFRGYDTLLEVAVLLIALLGILAIGRSGEMVPLGHENVMLRVLTNWLVPVMILVSAYQLWAGAFRPGGAFQAGAVLAAAAVLLHLANRLPAWDAPRFILRLGLIAGFLVFLTVTTALLSNGGLLRYPPSSASSLILLIETGLTVSLGLILAGLFLSLSEKSEH